MQLSQQSTIQHMEVSDLETVDISLKNHIKHYVPTSDSMQ